MVTNKGLGSPYSEWLSTIPLLHKLQLQNKEACGDIDPENPDWGMNGLNREALRDFKQHVKIKKYDCII